MFNFNFLWTLFDHLNPDSAEPNQCAFFAHPCGFGSKSTTMVKGIGKVGDGEDDNTDERAKPGSEEGTEAESERV